MGKMNLGMLVAVLSVMLAGCKSPPQDSMTAGHAVVGTCDAFFDVGWSLSRDFQSANRGAFIDIERGTNRQWLDSLINKHGEQAILDRALTSAESLAFKQEKLSVFTYPIAYYPAYWLVDTSNTVTVLDSVQIRRILTGEITNWQQVHGPSRPITVYLPLPGEGAWTAMIKYFGVLDSVSAIVCETAEAMLDSAKGDAGAFLLYSRPFAETPYRKVRFKSGEQEVSANVKQILEAPVYPFRLDITYVTTRQKSDVAAGFLTYTVSNLGQQRVMNLGYRPASVPVRIVKMKGS